MEEVLGVVVCICLRNLLSKYRCRMTERKHGGLLSLNFQKETLWLLEYWCEYHKIKLLQNSPLRRQ